MSSSIEPSLTSDQSFSDRIVSLSLASHEMGIVSFIAASSLLEDRALATARHDTRQGGAWCTTHSPPSISPIIAPLQVPCPPLPRRQRQRRRTLNTLIASRCANSFLGIHTHIHLRNKAASTVLLLLLLRIRYRRRIIMVGSALSCAMGI